MDSVKEYFKDYPAKDKCFETSDGLLFHEKGDANYHANSLKDKEVKTHNATKYALPAEDEQAKAESDAKKAEAAAKKAADAAAKKAEADAKKTADAAAKKAAGK